MKRDVALSRRAFVKDATALLSAAAALGLGACSGKPPADEVPPEPDVPDVPDVQEQEPAFDGTFIVGFDKGCPPYGYEGENGEYVGFDLDLAAAVCAAKGWTFVPTPIEWRTKDTILQSGEITCIWNGFTIEGRKADYVFTSPYLTSQQVIVVRADSGVTSLADLAGKNVVTQIESAAEELLTGEGDQSELGGSFARLDTTNDFITAFEMLEEGAYDAVAVDYPIAAFNVRGREEAFAILEEPLNEEHFGIGFARGNEDLAAEVEEQLKALDEEGVVQQICEEYADVGISYDLWCLPKAGFLGGKLRSDGS